MTGLGASLRTAALSPLRSDRTLDGFRPIRVSAETRAYLAALAPAVGGGEIADSVIVAAADPLSWTRAPLFVARTDRSTAAEPLQVADAPL